MAAPGMPANQLPSGPDAIMRRIETIERQIRELGPSIAASFQTTINTLTNLVNSTVVPETSSNGAADLATSTTSTVQTSVVFTVPAGYTQALIVASATAMAYNNTASADYLYAEVIVNGVQGGELYAPAGPGVSTGVNAPYFANLTGLTVGETITVAASVRTGFASWGASTANATNIYAQVLFLR
jgi:hypothetical protein